MPYLQFASRPPPKSRIPVRCMALLHAKCPVCSAAINPEFRCLRLLLFAVFFLLHQMRLSLQTPIAPGKKLAACLCLFAVLALWAPAWAIAWQAQPLDCCVGGMCAAHGHHSKSPERPPSPMDCDHHAAPSRSSGLVDCAISCCQTPEVPATVSTVFVMPLSAQISSPLVALAPQPTILLAAFVHSPEPASPPPRA